ncbi:MAG: dihydroorotate dehydrogenase-like protein [Planctomycetes bacterium]|nr:dihydroorotate dehydrogenase-like protein [Planctomycetota bacterium]
MSPDLTTTWLGLKLAHPIMPGASPMVDDLDTVRRLEDAGAPCIVMHSLFEEQILREQLAAHLHLDAHSESYAEALSYFPDSNAFALGPDAYLEQIRRIRKATHIPVIASLNGVTPGGWVEYAGLMAQAGASAVELNFYALASDPDEDAGGVERRALEVVQAVRAAVNIPLAVKISPFWTSLPNFARALSRAGADGLVLFNRFYQPDFDLENLESSRRLQLSDSRELLLRLHWTGILTARLATPVACSGGVHEALDAAKAIAAGAHAVQVVSSLLLHGPSALAKLRDGLAAWMEEREYASVAELRGCMNLARCPDPAAYERGNYIRLLQSWHGG